VPRNGSRMQAVAAPYGSCSERDLIDQLQRGRRASPIGTVGTLDTCDIHCYTPRAFEP